MLEHIQILEVTAREGDVCDDIDLSLTSLADGDSVAQVSNTAFDLDLVVEELFEGGQIEDFVADWLRTVDGILRKSSIACRKS